MDVKNAQRWLAEEDRVYAVTRGGTVLAATCTSPEIATFIEEQLEAARKQREVMRKAELAAEEMS